jgi:DNA replication ATP-dependent helicase Dna2
MRIDSCRENAEGYTYRFVRLQSESMPLAGQLATGDAVLVSVTDGAYGVGRGFIGELSSDWVDIQVEHDLTNLASTALGSNPVFRIDKDELIAGLGRIRENLATLFYAQGDERRRRLIVDLEPPRSSQTAIEGPCEVHLKKLNPTQRAAVRAAVCAQDYALILGMPGTGKTSTMVALIRILISQGKSVLLTSYTHSAVDTILAKVADLGDVILRLGNASKVRELPLHPSSS